jgi:U32 family peptidase
LCAQPCRREYSSKEKTKFLFNLKDNQLIDYVEKFAEIGVKSLKIEGRLKSGEYVYRVGAAYRKVLDKPAQIEIARKELELDLGRAKTDYFIGRDLENSISAEAGTGIYLGEIQQVRQNEILLETANEIDQNFRLRIHQPGIEEPLYFTVENFKKESFGYAFQLKNVQVKTGSKVFLVKLQERKFRNKLETDPEFKTEKIPGSFRNAILNSLNEKKFAEKEELFFRINSSDWLSRISFSELDGLFLAFPKAEWRNFNYTDLFLKENQEKIYIEFPKFIAEKSIGFYVALAEKMVQKGFRNFVISHLSQKDLIPEGCRIITNENVYAFNDAAIQFYNSEGIMNFIYPFEIDFETLESLNNKSGIIPLFFYPELFYSRMPVRLTEGEVFTGESEPAKFRRIRKEGITIIVPERPVSILQHKSRLSKLGFKRFLIDVSYDTFSKNRLKTLKTRYMKSEQIQPSTTFNFVKGMK